MNDIQKEWLFGKKIFVNEGGPSEDAFPAMVALAQFFQIRLTEGAELATLDMVRLASKMLGENVPEPFYRGFPESVRNMSPDQLLFDQLVHYTVTYGFGHFGEAGHSLFDQDFERLAFKEDVPIREYRAVTEEEARKILRTSVEDLLSGTRPLNDRVFELVLDYVKTHGDLQDMKIASKDTRIRLLVGSRKLFLADGLTLSDVLKVTERLQWDAYESEAEELQNQKGLSWEERVRRISERRQRQNRPLKNLALKNRDRKFIEKLIRGRLQESPVFRDCYERRADWAGLLHHIHFKPETFREKAFTDSMRSGDNFSVYSEVEKALLRNDPDGAVRILAEGKGAGAVVRQMNRLLASGAKPETVLPYLRTAGTVPLLQLLLSYSEPDEGRRVFMFSRLNLFRTHYETDEEMKRRRSLLPFETRDRLLGLIRGEIARRWLDKLGKVYVDDGMKKIALPLSESTSQGGPGVLPKGSRLALPEGKKIRAFTYWEKVHDIDLSVIGIDRDGNQKEFSWRTMSSNQSDAITYSGDQTSGYNGGSEYFDVDLEAFREKYPDVLYLIFCDNVYSGTDFADCVCRAGYMMRDTEDSGAVFEPKTVESAFTVNAKSTFAYLFGIDLLKREFVWLNSAVSGGAVVAGERNLSFLTRLFGVTDIVSVFDLLALQAHELTDDPEAADVVATDEEVPCRADALRIRSYDVEILLRLMEAR